MLFMDLKNEFGDGDGGSPMIFGRGIGFQPIK